MTPLLQDNYNWGGRKACSSYYSDKANNKKKLGFNNYESELLIKRITSTLSSIDLTEWQRMIPATSLTDMFLQSVIAKKQGDEFKNPIKHYPLKITVVDRINNEILVSEEIVLNAGEITDVLYVSKNNKYPDIAGSLKALLDTEFWRIRLTSYIDFKPHGTKFDCLIPLTGSGEIFLNQDGKTQWIFEHLLFVHN